MDRKNGTIYTSSNAAGEGIAPHRVEDDTRELTPQEQTQLSGILEAADEIPGEDDTETANYDEEPRGRFRRAWDRARATLDAARDRARPIIGAPIIAARNLAADAGRRGYFSDPEHGRRRKITAVVAGLAGAAALLLLARDNPFTNEAQELVPHTPGGSHDSRIIEQAVSTGIPNKFDLDQYDQWQYSWDMFADKVGREDATKTMLESIDRVEAAGGKVNTTGDPNGTRFIIKSIDLGGHHVTSPSGKMAILDFFRTHNIRAPHVP